MKKLASFLFGIFTVVILISALSGCQSDYSKSEGRIDRSGLNIVREDDVMVGDIHWQLLDVKNLGPQMSGESGSLQAIQGRFIYIEFSVESLSQDTRTLFDLKVIDDKGRVYSICNEAYGYFTAGPAACTFQDIIPSVKQTFSASFDVPLDSVDLILEVTDLKIPPQEKVYIDMGL